MQLHLLLTGGRINGFVTNRNIWNIFEPVTYLMLRLFGQVLPVKKHRIET